MSLKKQDPSLRVAANDPHLVSLGGGRLSTAVTIHYIPVGDTTIGSSPSCSVSLNGSGVKPIHCTIYRSEENQMTIVPESKSARILIDGNVITTDTNLTQGAMITIGKSNYLRFNNPAEAEKIRSAMGSNERISMPQIDFTQDARNSNRSSSGSAKSNTKSQHSNIETFYEENIGIKKTSSKYDDIYLNNSVTPKVFTADSITVNAPAKDVLGPKYENFTKNLMEKNLPKVNNTPTKNSSYDRYPKPGTMANFTVFPMNGINSEINTSQDKLNTNTTKSAKSREKEQEGVEEILKICTEYERQNTNSSTSSITSSPIVQNRIKTNGSLPREKKSPFHDLSPQQFNPPNCKQFFPEKKSSNTGYENVRIVAGQRVEINGTQATANSFSNYENTSLGHKYVPQSPRTKIRTNCTLSPKREKHITADPPKDYAQLVKNFEERLKLEMKDKGILKENQGATPSKHQKSEDERKKRNKNVHNLTLNISSVMGKDVITLDGKLDVLMKLRDEYLLKIARLKTQVSEIKQQEDEVMRDLNLEKALVNAEYNTVTKNLAEMKKQLNGLNFKIHRLEAQRNSSRVMQENQQAKLKQTIEMSEDQIGKLEGMLKENPSNVTIQEELSTLNETLENDKKTFEDLEFQYLEEETDWLACREDLQNQLKQLNTNIEDKQLQLLYLENQGKENATSASTDSEFLESNLKSVLNSLDKYRDELQKLDSKIIEISGKPISTSSSEEELPKVNGALSQSLFGSAEILSNRKEIEIMSRSVNENMFYNNIEGSTSTPKKSALKTVTIDDDITAEVVRRVHNIDQTDPLMKLKYNLETSPNSIEKCKFNLSLGSDDFEVNPLENRVPSQDDIDRICKVAANAPISTNKGASTKIFDSIKEIERNRQLLLAQQGSHVIEHERQRMIELKKKSQDEARAQYLQQISLDTGRRDSVASQSLECHRLAGGKENKGDNTTKSLPQLDEAQHSSNVELQRSPRPLSETNSEMSCDVLSENAFKSSIELSHYISSESNELLNRVTCNSESPLNRSKQMSSFASSPYNKRELPKHQRPLTRYLPIFSSDLDLRAHIESAGHQITLCPHVLIDNQTCRGYLHKLGATFHTWSRRWFLFNRKKRVFMYFSDKSEKKPRGGAYFDTIEEVYLDHLNVSKSGRPACTFIVKTKQRTFHLQAASDAAARIWIDAIITGAQGNLDY